MGYLWGAASGNTRRDFGNAAPPTRLPAVLSPEVGHPKGSALHGQCINGAHWFTGVGAHTSIPVNPFVRSTFGVMFGHSALE